MKLPPNYITVLIEIKNSLTLTFKLIFYSIYLILPNCQIVIQQYGRVNRTTQFFLTTGYENAFYSAVLKLQCNSLTTYLSTKGVTYFFRQNDEILQY